MLEFEHSLFKLLLLVAVLSAKPPGRKWLPFIIAFSFLLAFLPPPISIPIPWELLLGLTIPILFWQNSRRIINAQWAGKWKDILIWIVSAALFALVFWAFKELEMYASILFGLVAASLIWSVGETERKTSIVSMIGPFTLIFLLAEVEPMIQSPTQYLGGIFSGLFFGSAIALIAVFLTRKTQSRFRNVIPLLQIYLSYTAAYFAGVSAIAASLASVIVFVTVGLYIDIWPFKKIEPTPLNTWPGFIFVLVLFLLLGWQAHYPPSDIFLLEVFIGFVLSVVITWVGQRLGSEAFPSSVPMWRIGLRVSFLLFPSLLIWPRQTLEQPILIVYALIIAVVNLVIARVSLNYFLVD